MDRCGLRATVAIQGQDIGHPSNAELTALPRLPARDSDSVALLPTVVVQDELRSGRLVEYNVMPDRHDSPYAISAQRHFTPPLPKSLLKQSEADVPGTLDGRAEVRQRSPTAVLKPLTAPVRPIDRWVEKAPPPQYFPLKSAG
ncbi:MAG: hypothetical protein K2Q07_01795 [Burkholderiaceae bacterium]|nr:hypothetical protein [Burkholderiaceae bacterium]